ncbi:MAG: sigma-54-dependent Fis family transcriptional regulator [Deltaproteobacteria bacterium]|nr:sigma-54-dependent Fis family transcriptional regulator [Deltaproteobacteria bacterium]
MPDAEGSVRSILVVDDDAQFREMLCAILTRQGYLPVPAEDGSAALRRLEEASFDLVMTDVMMPGMTGLELLAELGRRGVVTPVIVMSAYGSIEAAFEAVRTGAYDYLPKPASKAEILLTLTKLEARENLRRTVVRLEKALAGATRFGAMIGRSPAMQQVYSLVEKVAPFGTTVLVTGESGTGKELVARELHRLSGRGPFVAVNCGAIPPPLLESELFGHVRGAFTDARHDRRGLFQEAHGGTLFLDEVSELPLDLQVKLLRVLQEGEVRRVGENRPVRVDARVVAATALDLDRQVLEGRFRKDLFFRINVVQVRLLPLRERLDDIPLLVEHFIRKTNERLGTGIQGIDRDALRCLLAWRWPGNARELENVVERSAVMAEGELITRDLLPPELAGGRTSRSLGDGGATDLSIKRGVAELEERLIRQALLRTGGNRTAASRLLEISQRALTYKIKDYAIDIPPK